ncbi:MAG TPA: CBS domain-containing protein, partial [Candidatus Binataceae bacterium]|nr:CBS domain-containing protein [Candidatus Binataceae bacterium]
EIFSGALVGGLWLIFIGLFLRAAAAGGYQSTMMDQTLRRVRVGDIMTREPVTLTAEMPVADAIEHYFLRLGYGGFPVVANGRVVGLLSLSQLRHCPSEERARKTVSEIMIPLDPRIEIEPEASAIGAIHKMNEANSRRLLVIDGGKLVGIITLTGLTRFVQIKRELSAEIAAD